MPKKFGVNTKKEEATERKKVAKQEKETKLIEKLENEYWAETDEKVLKKLAKDKEKEEKRLETLQRKKELKELVEKEEEELSKSKKQPVVTNSFSKGAVFETKDQDLRKLAEKKDKESEKQTNSYANHKIDMNKDYENENFEKMEEYQEYLKSGCDLVEGSGVDSILESLTITEEINHPEKRLKAAWNAYVDKYYDDLKKKYPNYRRNKLLHLLSTDFDKSKENPMVVFKIQKQVELLKQQLKEQK